VATRRYPKLRLTAQARRERRWATMRGVAVSLATLAVVLLLTLVGALALLGPGSPVATVPGVEGQPQGEAERILQGAGLEGQLVDEKYDDRVPPGVVLSQRPYAGKVVRRGRLVELVLSRGPRSAKVPEVTGQPVDDARTRLEQSYLRLGSVTHRASPRPAETVLEQRPAAGSRAARDQEVAVVVSGGEGYGSWVAPSGERWVFHTLHLVVPQGPSLQRVRVVLRSAGEDETVYDEIRRPGEEMSLDLRARADARLRVTLEDKRIYDERLD